MRYTKRDRTCKLCYSAERALRAHYAKTGRSEEWTSMSQVAKDSQVVRNKFLCANNRGKNRNLDVTLGKEMEFVTEHQFALRVCQPSTPTTSTLLLLLLAVQRCVA